MFFYRKSHRLIYAIGVNPTRKEVTLRSYALRINAAHLKLRIEKNYLLERDIAYKTFVLCLIVSAVSLQLDMSRMIIEDMHYDRMLKDNCYITDIPTLLTRIGLSDYHTLVAYLDYIQEMLSLRFNPRYVNYFSVAYDSGYYLNISLKQTLV